MSPLSRRTFLRLASITGGICSARLWSRPVWALAPARTAPCLLHASHSFDNDFPALIAPGNDPFITEVYALALELLLTRWFAPGLLSETQHALGAIALDSMVDLSPLDEPKLQPLRRESPLSTSSVHFPPPQTTSAEACRRRMSQYCSSLGKVDVADLRICGIDVTSQEPLQLKTVVNYSFAGEPAPGKREQRTGEWELHWRRNTDGNWIVTRWVALHEHRSYLSGPGFVDVTGRWFASVPSLADQLSRGVDDWRTSLDGAFGIDIYGNNGVSVGDYDNDGFDDIYVCQPAGLPNRLYRNRGDGTFEDVSAKAGVDVLDATSCALFADLRNSGYQDLIVVRTNGPLLFVNNGDGTFTLKPDGFRFTNPPQGALTAAAAADYNLDGFLDIYFCLYSYYQGLSDYQYPTPYYDAQNGPPNFLFRNRGDGTFEDVTGPSGLNVANSRYTLACAWNDFNNDGLPDLYVVNDFGRKVLYRNLGNGRFEDVSREQGVEDAGEGMSSTWFDYDNDGSDDLYVVNMWEAAGKRVTTQAVFMPSAPESARQVYRQDAEGNTLLHNDGRARRFRDVTGGSGTQVGGWNWSSSAWDVDGDGFADLYVANGFISGPIRTDLSSYYWRRIVAQSHAMGGRSKAYEDAWQQINEGIRSDYTWSGYQRNNFYINNRDGSFTEAGSLLGLGCLEDGRAFALADLDGDGRVEVVLKNRNAPQLRVLRNRMRIDGATIAFSLRGVKANRDAIGAVVELRTPAGIQRQTVTAGSGFLSQHSKTLIFALPAGMETVDATVHWPGGDAQTLKALPVGHRCYVEQGKEKGKQTPFSSMRDDPAGQPDTISQDATAAHTWLVEPIALPKVLLKGPSGLPASIPSAATATCVLFYDSSCAGSEALLHQFSQQADRLHARGLSIATVSFDTDPSASSAQSSTSVRFLAADETARKALAIFYRYLFQRHRDMPLPTVMLLNANGEVIKVYSGGCTPDHALEDFLNAPETDAARKERAMPFRGRYYGDGFHHNYFTFGVAFLQGDCPEQAEAYFKRAVELHPEQGGAYYNLGLIYLNQDRLDLAQPNLERAVQIDPKDANAWNNLGVVYGQRAQYDEAQRCFEKTLALQPAHPLALGNLVKLCAYKDRPADARRILDAAVAAEPGEPSPHFELAMFLVQQNEMAGAKKEFERVLALQPDNLEARNGLGVILMRNGDNAGALRLFASCVQSAPDFDRPYLNLAALLLGSGNATRAHDLLSGFLERHPDNQDVRNALREIDTHR